MSKKSGSFRNLTPAAPTPSQAPQNSPSTNSTANRASAPQTNGLPERKPLNPDEIRRRAYEKWEAAGRPGGDGSHFWVEAERELRQRK